MEVQNTWFAQVNNEVNSFDIHQVKMIEQKIWKRRSIYKLPASVTDLNENAYRPQVISFGPYHYHDAKLWPMEEHKDRILCHFLRRSRKPLEFYFNLLADAKDDLMDAYYPRWFYNENIFLSIMVRDGCFMLEILQSYTKPITELDYDSNDPIFSDHGRLHFLPYIKRDMLKLENQLPMRVLETLLQKDVKDVNQLVCQFFFQEGNEAHSLGRCEHVLDLYRKVLLEQYSTVEPCVLQADSILPGPSIIEMQAVIPDSIMQESPYSNGPNPSNTEQVMQHVIRRGDDEDNPVIRPAKELYEAGIRIRKSTKRNLRDIKFDPSTGTLTVPRIVVDDTTEALFLNLIAFERFHVEADNSVTAYAFFMDNIINDAKDIILLHSKDIVQNAFGSDEAAAHLFNSLSKEVALGKYGSLKQVNKDVSQYCKRWWPRWRSYFFRTYLRNPWILISVIAATALFILTVIQTVYTVMSFHKA